MRDYVIKNPCRQVKKVKIREKMEMPFSDEDIA